MNEALTTATPAPAAGTPLPGSLIHPLASLTERLDYAQLFPKVQPVEVELGSGDGSFLAQYAAAHPERNFIGVERLLGRMRKLDRKGRRRTLTNLRVLRLEAGYLTEYLLPQAAATAMHVYFPDPWPKRRHQRHRLINQRFAAAARRALAPAGMLYLRTDNQAYFTWMLEVMGAAEGFTPVETPADLAALVTDFEREFNAQGIPTLRAAYQRVVTDG